MYDYTGKPCCGR